MHRDPQLLHRLLAALGNALPFSLLLIVDQAEEIFTQLQGPEVLEMLTACGAANASGYKLIVSMRTEYFGRMLDRLRTASRRMQSVREYLLTEFDHETLTGAIVRPTLNQPLPYTADIPFEHYHFRFADGFAADLSKEVQRFAAGSRDSVLPLIQVICSQLHDRVLARPSDQRTIIPDDLAALGGVQGGMVSHVEALMETIFGSSSDRKALRDIIMRLSVEQPDGTLTTALLPIDDLRAHWTGASVFEHALELAARNEYRLLRLDRLRDQYASQRQYVSLGHDSLAIVAQTWRREEERSKRHWQFAGVAVGVLLITLGASFLIARARVMDRQKKQIQANYFVESSGRAVNDLSLLLAAEAFRVDPSARTRGAVLSALEREPRLVSTLPGNTNGVCQATFATTAPLLAILDCSGSLYLWDTAALRQQFAPFPIVTKQVLSLVPLGDSRVATALNTGEVKILDLQKRAQITDCRFEELPADIDHRPTWGAGLRAAFSADGLTFASAMQTDADLARGQTTVEIRNTADCKPLRRLRKQGGVQKMVYSSKGSMLAISGVDRDGTCRM